MTLEKPSPEAVIKALRGLTAGDGVGWDPRRAQRYPQLAALEPVRQARIGAPGALSDGAAFLMVLNCVLPTTQIRPARELSEKDLVRVMLRVAFNLVGWPGGVMARRERLLDELQRDTSPRTWMEREIFEIKALGHHLHAMTDYPCSGRSLEDAATLERRRELKRLRRGRAESYLQLALLELREDMSRDDAVEQVRKILESLPNLARYYRRDYSLRYTPWAFLREVLRALQNYDYDLWRIAWGETGPIPMRRLSDLLGSVAGGQAAYEAYLRTKSEEGETLRDLQDRVTAEIDATFNVLAAMLEYFETQDEWERVLPPHVPAHA